MSIKVDVYSTKKSTSTTEKIYHLSLWGLLALSILLIQLKFIEGNWFSILAIVLLVALILIQTFSTGKYQGKLIGTIEFDENHIVWKEEKIIWEELKQIIVENDDYDGGVNRRNDSELDNSLTIGLDHKLSILTENGEKIEGIFYIQSNVMSEKIYSLFWKIVKENKVSLKNAKTLIHPKNYKEHQELKKYYD